MRPDEGDGLMTFIPKYAVSYRGVIHKAGVPFEIDADDAADMTAHGEIVSGKAAPESEKEPDESKDDEIVEQPVRKAGRPKKSN